MLGKLLKYDLKHMIKGMSVFYILALFFAILTRLISLLDQSFMVGIVKSITNGCVYAMIANIIINVAMRSWVRFRDSIYKDEGYLTHTLPVTKNAIYDSKFFQTLIVFVISFIVVLLSLFIAFYTKERWDIIVEYIRSITTGLQMNIAVFVIEFLAIVFLEIFNAIQCGFLGLIIGYKQSNAKIGYSVLVGFSAYLVAQSLVLLCTYIMGLFNSSIMDLFKNKILMDTQAFKIVAIVVIIIYIVIIVGMNLLCKKLLKKGVDLE